MVETQEMKYTIFSFDLFLIFFDFFLSLERSFEWKSCWIEWEGDKKGRGQDRQITKIERNQPKDL